MKELTEDLYKIWNPFLIVSMILLGMIYKTYFANIYYPTYYSANDSRTLFETVTLCLDWKEKYGIEISDGEIEGIAAQYQKELNTLSEEIYALSMSNTEMQKRGINSYESWQHFIDGFTEPTDDQRQEFLNAEVMIQTIVNNTRIQKVNVIKRVLQNYEIVKDPEKAYEYYVQPVVFDRLSPGYGEKVRERIYEISNSDMRFGYIPQELVHYINSYFRVMTTWVIITISVLLSVSFYANHNQRRNVCRKCSILTSMERTYQVHIISGIITAIAITIITYTLYWIPLFRMDLIKFVDFQMSSSLLSPWFSWFNGTFGDYLAAFFAIALIMGISTALFVIAALYSSRNRICALLKVLIVSTTMGIVLNHCILHQFPDIYNYLRKLTGIPIFPYITLGLLLLVGIGINFLVMSYMKNGQGHMSDKIQ